MNHANRNVEQLQAKITSLQDELVRARQENDRYCIALVEAEGKYCLAFNASEKIRIATKELLELLDQMAKGDTKPENFLRYGDLVSQLRELCKP